MGVFQKTNKVTFIKTEILSKNIQNIHAKIATIIDVLIISLLSFKGHLPSQFQSHFVSKMNVVIGTLTIILVGFGASFFLSKKIAFS